MSAICVQMLMAPFFMLWEIGVTYVLIAVAVSISVALKVATQAKMNNLIIENNSQLLINSALCKIKVPS